VHKVSIARVIQKTEADDAAELVIVTEAVKEKHLEDALEHLADMDTTREIGTVIREY
jgi:homoserine dehydrogenase